jgi:hypothetical protein
LLVSFDSEVRKMRGAARSYDLRNRDTSRGAYIIRKMRGNAPGAPGAWAAVNLAAMLRLI